MISMFPQLTHIFPLNIQGYVTLSNRPPAITVHMCNTQQRGWSSVWLQPGLDRGCAGPLLTSHPHCYLRERRHLVRGFCLTAQPWVTATERVTTWECTYKGGYSSALFSNKRNRFQTVLILSHTLLLPSALFSSKINHMQIVLNPDSFISLLCCFILP